MKEKNRPVWFPAKRYGWGWGLPNCWQGWLVVSVYVALAAVAAVFLPPDRYPLPFAGLLVALTLMLLVVCYLKGEKPRWRWGGK